MSIAPNYPAYGAGFQFAGLPVTPRKPRLDTITYLFESDDGLWYQGLEVEIGYSMVREQAVEGQPWCWQYDHKPRVLRVERIIDGPNGFGDASMMTRTPRADDAQMWLSRAEWILRTRFDEVDAAIRGQL
jgi:hypothetical protein